ncbi:MAG: hypothetical protein JSR82_22195 [Verrucomicrobia bacterium]|nr:hypothetical protein [Verrucomicrobiota bacterium]
MPASLPACPCREAVPEDRFYTLEFYAGRGDRHPGFAELVQVEEWLIVCRRCRRRWRGEHIVGGGIYGDTLWRPERA